MMPLNVNSLAAQDCKKISLLEACYAIHRYDSICVSETYLDSSLSNDEKRYSNQGIKSTQVTQNKEEPAFIIKNH